MGDYTAQIGAVRQAARSASSAGKQAGKVDLAGTLGGVGASLPGSQSGPAAGNLATAWGNLVASWSEDAQHYADGLSAAADRYLTQEESAERDLRAACDGAMGPR